LLQEHLALVKGNDGYRLYEITARNRETDENGDDPVLSKLHETAFDELWLFAVDTGDGLSKADCEGITSFRQRGGGILSTRDHQDLGSSLCTLGGIGEAHYFHSKNFDPYESNRQRDDQATTNIDFPNYHSGANGDYQKIKINQPAHELLQRSDGSLIEYFPSHPHEGGIGAPATDNSARVIAVGTSQMTNRPFNLIVAFERITDEHGNHLGRAIAESSFHHFVDYNWDTSKGCPSFVEEAPGNSYKQNPEALKDIKTYVESLAGWLAPVGSFS
jgi:hypothetical protein